MPAFVVFLIFKGTKSGVSTAPSRQTPELTRLTVKNRTDGL